MNATEFCYWLRGALELTDIDTLDKGQVDMIREHLALVFTKVTSPRELARAPSEPDPTRPWAVPVTDPPRTWPSEVPEDQVVDLTQVELDNALEELERTQTRERERTEAVRIAKERANPPGINDDPMATEREWFLDAFRRRRASPDVFPMIARCR